jgi:hypothetical protein
LGALVFSPSRFPPGFFPPWNLYLSFVSGWRLICSMYRALGTQWATSVLGFASIAMIPIPFAFYKYGPRVRERSKFAQVL